MQALNITKPSDDNYTMSANNDMMSANNETISVNNDTMSAINYTTGMLENNCVMSANNYTLSGVPTFIHTNRGGRILAFDGYLFRINRFANNGNTYWKCKVKQCRTTVVLDHKDGLISVHGQHNHESNELEGLHRRADVLLKQQRRALLGQLGSQPVHARKQSRGRPGLTHVRTGEFFQFVKSEGIGDEGSSKTEIPINCSSDVRFHKENSSRRKGQKRSADVMDSSSTQVGGKRPADVMDSSSNEMSKSVKLALELMSRDTPEGQEEEEEQEEKYPIEADQYEDDVIVPPAATQLEVNSPNVTYTPTHIEARYVYQTTDVTVEAGTGNITAHPRETIYTFRTNRTVPRLGVMLVGWGGNNGSTVTAAVIANRLGLTWPTKDGLQIANYYGSITQVSTVLLGSDESGNSVHVPLKALLPMVEPNDIIFDGWDISGTNLADAMERAGVLDYGLQQQLRPHMQQFIPRPSIYYRDFIADNQSYRADNIIEGGSKWDHLCRLRQDIRDFKIVSGVDKVIVVWTANTERFSDVLLGLNDTADSLMDSIRCSAPEVSPSTIFAVASILEGASFINGSPQNTCVPGVIELASREKVFISGDDLKSGPTKLKSVLVDFLVGTGIKPTSIVSYSHVGNNDGRTISAQLHYSAEISKNRDIGDVVTSNKILYGPSERPDHCVVNKYVQSVGDSKRAMDEYTSEIMMGGRSTISVHSICDDSLLASPIILDLVILTEVCQRINFRVADQVEFQPFHSVLSLLSYLLKAPLVPYDTPQVSTLSSQRACIENVFRACIGLAPINHMLLEHKHQATVNRIKDVSGTSQIRSAEDLSLSDASNKLINSTKQKSRQHSSAIKTEVKDNSI